MNKKTVEILTSLVFLVLGLIMLVSSQEMTPRIADDMGSGFMPRLIGIGFIILSVCKLAISLKNKYNEKIIHNATIGKGLLTMAIFGAYVLSFKHLGFVIATFLYLVFQITLLKWDGSSIKNGLRRTMIISIIVPVFVYVLFSNVLNLVLPVGLLG